MSGFFVLSIDTDDSFETQTGDRAGRPAVERFTRLLEGHAIPATWVVGEAAVLGAWGGRRGDAPESHLLDVVDAMATPQEIAVSPIPDARGAGLAGCLRFAADRDRPIRTLALPAEPPLDARYRPFGFAAYRRAPAYRAPGRLGDALLRRPVPVWRPSDLERTGETLVVPVSVGLAAADPPRRRVAEATRCARILKGLARARDEDALIHVAFRLADLARSEALFRTIEDILFHVAEARTGAGLRVVTVADPALARRDETASALPRRAA